MLEDLNIQPPSLRKEPSKGINMHCTPIFNEKRTSLWMCVQIDGRLHITGTAIHAIYSLDLFLGFTTVTLSFVFDNYYPHMD